MKKNNFGKVLVVAAHPDDEVLGCGGVIKKLTNSGNDVFVLILSAGKASREKSDNELAKEQVNLSQEMIRANKILGVKDVFLADFPDNAFDSIPLLKIVKRIEEIKSEIRPKTIFTHHVGDMNIDHQLTHKAVLTATRPMVDEPVKEIYSFEIPSSTEWNSFSKDTVFVPNVFYDISSTLQDKIDAMTAYQSELHEYSHPRSLMNIKDIAKVWGAKVGLNRVEAFMLIRKVVQ